MADDNMKQDPAPGAPSEPTTPPSIGYRPFPPIMNLYSNYSSLTSAFKTARLCGDTPSDFLYLVELHLGYVSTGPLSSGRGYYLHNGTSKTDPILAATGDKAAVPYAASMLDTDVSVRLPPRDVMGKHAEGSMATEVMRSSVGGQGRGVAFRFVVEVGVKPQGVRREEFEWRKMEGGGGEVDGKGRRYTLFRFPSTGLSGGAAPEGDQIVAELVFANVWSMKHIFKLDLKGAGRTGELGERWSLMVVMTALGLFFLRQLGRTKKTTIAAAQRVQGEEPGVSGKA